MKWCTTFIAFRNGFRWSFSSCRKQRCRNFCRYIFWVRIPARYVLVRFSVRWCHYSYRSFLSCRLRCRRLYFTWTLKKTIHSNAIYHITCEFQLKKYWNSYLLQVFFEKIWNRRNHRNIGVHWSVYMHYSIHERVGCYNRLMCVCQTEGSNVLCKQLGTDTSRRFQLNLRTCMFQVSTSRLHFS